MGALADEECVIDHPCNATANQRAGPVDPVVCPCPADQGRTEGDRRVHRCTVEGTAGQDVGSNNETNCNGCDDPQIALLWIDRGGIDSVDQAEGHHYLEHQSVPHAHAGR